MDAGKFSLLAMTRALEHGLNSELSERIKIVLKEAYDGHMGQFRMSRNQRNRVPFIVHPVGVAKIAIQHYAVVNNLSDNLETVVCVALAHDLLEDTRVSSSRIEDLAGKKVRYYVEALTKSPSEITGRTGEDRNQELLQKILSAGPTTVFLKICDSIHNLSYPAITPINLLEKAIKKAKNQYLSLLEHCPLGEALRRSYAATIENAEKSLEEEMKYARTLQRFTTLEDAVRECVEISDGKVLEMHDITATIKHICGVQSVGCWRLKSESVGLFEPVAGLDTEVRNLHWPAGELMSSAKVFSGELAHRIGASFCRNKPSNVITIGFRLDTETVFVFAIGMDDGIKETWLNKDTATMLVQLLAHRLILSEADRRGRLAIEAARLGLQLRTEVAMRLGIQDYQLSELQRWRLRCEQAVASVSNAVNLALMSDACFIPIAREIRIESRVKTVDSIMNKMLATHVEWPNYEIVEDIAGVRVICPTQKDVVQLERALLSPVANIQMHPSIAKPRRDYAANPTNSGYRSLHLILQVETHSSEEGVRAVPCELQIRTMFQDTWAKLSHALAYHGGSEAKGHVEQLKKLSGILKAYEESSDGT